MTKRVGYGTLTKQKYQELCQVLESTVNNKECIQQLLLALKQVLDFDPDASTYTKEQAERIKAYRNKKKEEGVSTYVSSGAKSAYHKRKVLSAQVQ